MRGKEIIKLINKYCSINKIIRFNKASIHYLIMLIETRDINDIIIMVRKEDNSFFGFNVLKFKLTGKEDFYVIYIQSIIREYIIKNILE